MSGQVQKKITDYFVRPDSSKNKDEKSSWEDKVLFATILELPSELFLSILDHLRLEKDYYYIIRRLNRVCRRFSSVFGPFVRESLRLEECSEHGIVHSRPLQSERATSELRHLEVRYPQHRAPSFRYYSLQLMSIIRTLQSLNSLTLHSVLVNDYTVAVIGQLPTLTSLSYDNVVSFTEFPELLLGISLHDDEGFKPISCSLRSLTAKFFCHDHPSMRILGKILKSSANTLVSLALGFQNAAGRLPADVICSVQFSSMKSLSLHHVEFNDTVIQHFLSTPTTPLIDFNIIAHNLKEGDDDNDPLWSGVDGVLLSQLPRIGSLPPGAIDVGMDAFAVHLKPDTSGNLIAQDIAVFEADWELVPTVLERCPHLQTLNMWESGYPSVIELLEQGLPSTRLKVLRLSVGGYRPDPDSTEMPLFYCDTEEVNSWCNCSGCSLGVFTEEGRRKLQQEWEDTQWHRYDSFAHNIASALPSLQVVEWFFGDLFTTFRLIEMPFWRWTIERTEQTNKPKLKRELHNWRPTHPFSVSTPWTFTLGMSPDVSLEDDHRRVREAHIEAREW